MTSRLPTEQIGHSLSKRSKRNLNCHVCRLGYEVMSMVTRLAINGTPYTDITRQLQLLADSGAILRAPSYGSVVNHCRSHLPYKDEAIRRHIERRAAEDGLDIEAGAESLLRPVTIAEVTMQKGFSLILEGKATPTVKETLDAAKLVSDFERASADSTSAVEALAQVNLILQAVREVVPQELWGKITHRLEELKKGHIDAPEIEAAPAPETS